MCPNYDLCENCIDIHDVHYDHLFFRITKNKYNDISCVTNRSEWDHHKLCNICNSNIVGYIHRCIECEINICEICEMTNQHDIAHRRIKSVSS